MGQYFLEIGLRSALTTSSGRDWANQMDVEIATDDRGLPFLPARRLKGLWRDGLRELGEALSLCGVFATGTDEALRLLFGLPGKKSGGEALVTIADAYLEDFQPGLAAGALQCLDDLLRDKVITRAEIMGAFADARSQTAIDPATGSADENTLRSSRTLHRRRRFRAPVCIRESRYVDILALAAAAVRRMGLGRTRGLGQVTLRLIEETPGGGKPHDRTQQILDSLDVSNMGEVLSGMIPAGDPA